MRGCISISRTTKSFALASLLLLFWAGACLAADGKASTKGLPSDEDDFSTTPFTDYAEFNQEEEEENETKFLQYGRLFGVSVGLGNETIFGNRGKLWQGGFPVIEIKVHYWFNFNLALDLGVAISKHNYDGDVDNQDLGSVQVSMTHVGAQLKYYFDTRDLSAPISFASPYLLGGIGSFNKTETSENQGSTSDSAFALDGGAGLEFAISPRKTYFAIEGKLYTATFADTNTDRFASVADDLTGTFFTVVGSFLFTW